MASKSNADTSKLSHEEIERHNLQGSKRPPGKSPGGVLHQQGGAGLKNAGRYPMALYTVLVLAGVGSFMYYRSTHPNPDGQAGSHSPSLQREQEQAKC
ncbi:unnamed protein product [Calypogeia fissa]